MKIAIPPGDEIGPEAMRKARRVLEALDLPMAAMLSAALMLRHSFGPEDEAARIERAVCGAMADGVRRDDPGGSAGTAGIGGAALARL